MHIRNNRDGCPCPHATLGRPVPNSLATGKTGNKAVDRWDVTVHVSKQVIDFRAQKSMPPDDHVLMRSS